MGGTNTISHAATGIDRVARETLPPRWSTTAVDAYKTLR